ncbi:EamA family transporter, partial [Slackia sp.]
MKKELPSLFYKLLIIAATIIWGFSFVVVKDAVDAVSPAWLMGMRFVATAAILAVVFHETLHANFDTSHLFAGVVLGVFSFLGFWIQTIGITDTTPGRNAFLTATYCVMVPFLYWIVAKRRPTAFNLVAAVMCIAGVGFVSLGGDFTFSMRWGDSMTQ